MNRLTPTDTLILGAVAYDPKVVTIWDGFIAYFAKHGLDFDYVLYTTYERQVEAHLAGHFHVAWNSPLAWLQAERAAAAAGRKASTIAMRDTDRDLTSVVVVRADDDIQTLGDLAGKRVAVGAKDSPQATLIPLHDIAERTDLTPYKDFEVLPFDVLVGKHGDHIGGERDAIKALLAGDADAACILDGNHLGFTAEGTIRAGQTRVLHQTGTFDHCNFTVLEDAPASVPRFRELLLAMSYDDPEVRPLLDLEGLKVWKDGRTEGYALLAGAMERFGGFGW